MARVIWEWNNNLSNRSQRLDKCLGQRTLVLVKHFGSARHNVSYAQLRRASTSYLRMAAASPLNAFTVLLAFLMLKTSYAVRWPWLVCQCLGQNKHSTYMKRWGPSTVSPLKFVANSLASVDARVPFRPAWTTCPLTWTWRQSWIHRTFATRLANYKVNQKKLPQTRLPSFCNSPIICLSTPFSTNPTIVDISQHQLANFSARSPDFFPNNPRSERVYRSSAIALTKSSRTGGGAYSTACKKVLRSGFFKLGDAGERDSDCCEVMAVNGPSQLNNKSNFLDQS